MLIRAEKRKKKAFRVFIFHIPQNSRVRVNFKFQHTAHSGFGHFLIWHYRNWEKIVLNNELMKMNRCDSGWVTAVLTDVPSSVSRSEIWSQIEFLSPDTFSNFSLKLAARSFVSHFTWSTIPMEVTRKLHPIWWLAPRLSLRDRNRSNFLVTNRVVIRHRVVLLLCTPLMSTLSTSSRNCSSPNSFSYFVFSAANHKTSSRSS